MTREQAIKRLCALVSKVGTEVFNSQLTHDCFCEDRKVDITEVIDEEVIKFIENATIHAIETRIV